MPYAFTSYYTTRIALDAAMLICADADAAASDSLRCVSAICHYATMLLRAADMIYCHVCHAMRCCDTLRRCRRCRAAPATRMLDTLLYAYQRRQMLITLTAYAIIFSPLLRDAVDAAPYLR